MKRAITDITIYSNAAMFLKNKSQYHSKSIKNLDAFDISFLIEAFTGIPKEEALDGMMNIMERMMKKVEKSA